jgi:hypothetical protein
MVYNWYKSRNELIIVIGLSRFVGSYLVFETFVGLAAEGKIPFCYVCMLGAVEQKCYAIIWFTIGVSPGMS